MVLGAGASRSVSYASKMNILSALDADFFELLQRLRSSASPKDVDHIEFVIKQGLSDSSERLWQSFERLFYTVWYRAQIRQWLFSNDGLPHPQVVEEHFARSIQALLRAAHGREVCSRHAHLLKLLRGRDTIISFNYDLVPERSMAERFLQKPYGAWLYGLAGARPAGGAGVPKLLKLHGSVNWKWADASNIESSERIGGEVTLRQNTWNDFLRGRPSYQARPAEIINWEEDLPTFPIMLPFWEKRVNLPPWREPWEEASRRLRETESLLVWGYSLPATDLKVRELLDIGLTPRERGGCSKLSSGLKHLCVIDPNNETADRWRRLFLHAQFWRYRSIEEFNFNDLPWR